MRKRRIWQKIMGFWSEERLVPDVFIWESNTIGLEEIIFLFFTIEFLSFRKVKFNIIQTPKTIKGQSLRCLGTDH